MQGIKAWEVTKKYRNGTVAEEHIAPRPSCKAPTYHTSMISGLDQSHEFGGVLRRVEGLRQRDTVEGAKISTRWGCFGRN